MATPINQKQHSETCSMKHDGQEVIVTGTFEAIECDGGPGVPPYTIARPTRCVITHVSAEGTTQEIAIDGPALVQLRLLLARMYRMHDDGVAIPLGQMMQRR